MKMYSALYKPFYGIISSTAVYIAQYSVCSRFPYKMSIFKIKYNFWRGLNSNNYFDKNSNSFAFLRCVRFDNSNFYHTPA